MRGRRGRGPRLTMRKSNSRLKRRADGSEEDKLDEDEITVPDEAKWKNMTPYGVFAISDKDGAKYRFKRGDIATILPYQKAPGTVIEPHEYWVGEILEIRADAGSEDSTVIWAKVRWYYNAQDAHDIVKSLDTSHIGKFERLVSSHWDFVLPHTFNEVISMPQLLSFPHLKRKKSLTKRLKLKGVHGDTESISAATTSTVVDDDELEPGIENQDPIGPDMFYWRYTVDIASKKITPKPGLKSCICSVPYSPDNTSLLKGVMFFCPRPSCRTSFHVGCLRDAKSIWVPDDQEVVVPTPSPSPTKSNNKGRGRAARISTGFDHVTGKAIVGNAKGKEKAQAPEDDLVDIQWLTPRALRRITCTPDSNHAIDLLSFLSTPPRTVSAAPKKQRKAEPPSTSQTPLVSLLQRVYARQIHHHQHLRERTAIASRKRVISGTSNKSKHSVPSVISTKSGGSWIEVEDLLVSEDVDVEMNTIHDTPTSPDSVSHLATPKSPAKSKPKSKGLRSTKTREKDTMKEVQVDLPTTTKHTPLRVQSLTPETLLATLFLLPSPFPPSYASATSSQPDASSIPKSNTLPPSTSSAASTSAQPPPLTQNSATTTNSSNPNAARDLLLLAAQPLLRGAGYIPYLGPTGNVNLVLAARRLVWEVLGAVGALDLTSTSLPAIATATTDTKTNTTISAPPAQKKRGRQPKNKSKPVASSVSVSVSGKKEDSSQENQELDEAEQDVRDAEDFRKILECVHSLLDGWKTRFKDRAGVVEVTGKGKDRETEKREEGKGNGKWKMKVLPPGAEVDDGIVIRDGLVMDHVDDIIFPVSLSSKEISRGDPGRGEDVRWLMEQERKWKRKGVC